MCFEVLIAQTPVLPLYNADIDINRAYYKDLQDEMNRFIGEWKYENRNNSLTIIFKKKEEQFVDYGSVGVYEDFLVGEYQYIENGIELINTLPNILNNLPDPYSYNINANIIKRPVPNNPNACPQCGPNDVILRGSFSDPDIEILGLEPTVYIRHKIENGLEKIIFSLYLGGNIIIDINEGDPPHTTFRLPAGTYELIKQP
jgi:hypothetical protein